MTGNWSIPCNTRTLGRLTCLDEISAICCFSSYYFDCYNSPAWHSPWPCIHGHTKHSLQHIYCIGHPRGSRHQQGKHQGSIWPGGKGFLPCLEEGAWEEGEAEGLFWQSLETAGLTENSSSYSSFFTDFIEWWDRKTNLCLRNCFISMEKLPELWRQLLFHWKVAFALKRLQKFGRVRNYKALTWFYDKCDNII